MSVIYIISFFVFLILLFITFFTLFLGAPYVATQKKVVIKIVDLVDKKSGKRVVDLGSGDGRILIEFAKKGFDAHGYEVNPFLVVLSGIKIFKEGLSRGAKVFCKNFWNVDLRDYDVVVVYGIGHIMYRLEKKLKSELKKGAKVITYSYKFPNLKYKKKLGNIYFYKM